ncbi:MAG: M23 family metallopeptidase [Patescibacteria group bacterium]
MKRYSLAYAGVLVLVAFTTLMLLPKGLDPQEFLAKASEQYEPQSGIFHEERLSQRFENDIVVEASLEEVWMDEQGNFLQTIRNPDTKELVQATMTKVDEYGDIVSYEPPEWVEEMGGLDEWDLTFAGNKYTCTQTEIVDETIYKAILKIAEEDPTVYTIEGQSSEYIEDAALTPEQQLFSQDNSATAVKELLETLAEGNSSTRSAYIDGDYFVFKWEANEQTIYSYFNLATYKLEKQKLTFAEEPNRYDLTTYLAHEYLPADKAAEIFDPSNYDLAVSPTTTLGIPNSVEESGCYYKGEKLSEDESKAVLDSVPVEALNEWDKMLIEMQIGPFKEEIEETQVEIFEGDLPENVSFVRATEGNISAGYTAGHYGYDIANENGTPLVAIASGTVVEVGELGLWNGGYGNYFVIDHGNGYTSKYAHCNEVYVEAGDEVSQGQELATMGSSGRVYGNSGAHLHFELIYNGMKVNPSVMNVW